MAFARPRPARVAARARAEGRLSTPKENDYLPPPPYDNAGSDGSRSDSLGNGSGSGSAGAQGYSLVSMPLGRDTELGHEASGSLLVYGVLYT